MEIIISAIEKIISYGGPFIVLLGLLIFVHELGHFLVAKYYGVKVETFSLGFGKKLLQYKYGDTVYCLSLIPLGGYVKMFGDDPTTEVPEDQKYCSFLHKPVGARIAIVLAGPLMNLFFAAIVFALVAFLGEKFPDALVGDIKTNSPAFDSGFRSGDRVLAINNEPVKTWNDVVDKVSMSANKKLIFSLQRENSEDKIEVSAKPTLADNENLLSTERKIGKIEGLAPSSLAPVVGISNPNSPAALAGFSRLELIKEINGKKIQFFRDLEPALKSSAGNTSITFTISQYLNNDKDQTRTLTINNLPETLTTPLQYFGFENSHNFLYQVKPDSPAHKNGLQPGDKIISVNNVPINQWEDIVEVVKSYRGDNSPIHFVLSRGGEEISQDIVPEMTELLKPSGAEDNRFTVGIIPALMSTAPTPVTIRHRNPLTALKIGVAKSWHWTKMVGLSFLRMIQREVSPKNIGGVITIGKFAGQSYQVGLSPFLKLMAIISINLFLLNLLPVPVLDGGHLLFFTIEALRGAPISMRKMEIAQQVGLVILMTLMVFALFNDISNLLNPPF